MNVLRLIAYHVIKWHHCQLNPRVPDYPIRLLLLRAKVEAWK